MAIVLCRFVWLSNGRFQKRAAAALWRFCFWSKKMVRRKRLARSGGNWVVMKLEVALMKSASFVKWLVEWFMEWLV